MGARTREGFRTSGRSAAGFTLIEVMAVITVIAVLVAGFIVNSVTSLEETRCVACEQGRVLYEGMELQFQHKFGKPTNSLGDLVTAGYVNKVGCPRGGVLTWEVVDASLGNAHRALVCSIHGPKRWLRAGSAGATAAPDAEDTPPAGDPAAAEDPAASDGPAADDAETSGGAADTAGTDPFDTPAPPGPSAAFEDGFDGKVATGWTETKGKTWQVSDGRYVGGTTGKGKGEHRTFTGDESWTDYTVGLDLDLTAGTAAGVYFRTTTPASPSGYVFGFDAKAGTFTLSTVKKGTIGKAFASAAAPPGFAWVGTNHAVSIEVKGSTYTVTVDGVKAVSGTNSTYKKGAIGLRVASGSVAGFDNVVVQTK